MGGASCPGIRGLNTPERERLHLIIIVIIVIIIIKIIMFTVPENVSFKLYWNRSILTDKTIPFNRPDITFINKKTKNTFLIDIAVQNTHNLAKTITDKQNKYQELANELCAMWKQNTAQVIPLIISSTAVNTKSLPQSLKRLNLHPNTYIQLQKSITLGTCSTVRYFLNYKSDHRAYCC
jgi:hypothetical protein